MRIVHARNYSEAMPCEIDILSKEGILVGETLWLKQPVTVRHDRPTERVLFFWLDPLQNLLNILSSLSVNIDMCAVERATDYLLKDRCAILTTGTQSEMHFRLDGDRLDATVYDQKRDVCRDNPGPYSMILEYVAFSMDVKVGRCWYQAQNIYASASDVAHLCRVTAPNYPEDLVPLIKGSTSAWRTDLQMFVTEGENAIGYSEPFFRRVALPILRARNSLQQERVEEALEHALGCSAPDWQLAAVNWIERE